MLFSRNKSPCGSVPQKVTFSELTLRELIRFYRDLKHGGTPIFVILVTFFLRLCQFWSKTKMVRIVHTNNFCEMGLEISDPKIEFWTENDILEGSENSKICFGVQN